MKLIRRVLLAGFIAPLAVFPAVIVATLAIHIVEIIQLDFLSPDQLDDMLDFFEFAAVLSVFGVLFGWFFMVVFGFPAYALLWLGGLAQPIPGALVGAVFGVLFGAAFDNSIEPTYVMIMMACGASVAATFCYLAGRWERAI